MTSSSWRNKDGLPRRPEAVFLDRDGVINRDSPDYVTDWSQFRFLPGSLAAIATLTAAGIRIFVVTNQSAVARGLMTAETLADMHRRLERIVRHNGGRIQTILHCPHHPDDGCGCRKPQPGMIIEAQTRYNLDLKKTFMIGDRASDIACGRAAGCGGTILVRSGPQDARPDLARQGIRPDWTVADLAAAVQTILGPRDAPP